MNEGHFQTIGLAKFNLKSPKIAKHVFRQIIKISTRKRACDHYMLRTSGCKEPLTLHPVKIADNETTGTTRPLGLFQGWQQLLIKPTQHLKREEIKSKRNGKLIGYYRGKRNTHGNSHRWEQLGYFIHTNDYFQVSFTGSRADCRGVPLLLFSKASILTSI